MIDKVTLLENLVILADNLDDMGLKKDAEVVDGMIEKVAAVPLSDVGTNLIAKLSPSEMEAEFIRLHQLGNQGRSELEQNTFKQIKAYYSRSARGTARTIKAANKESFVEQIQTRFKTFINTLKKIKINWSYAEIAEFFGTDVTELALGTVIVWALVAAVAGYAIGTFIEKVMPDSWREGVSSGMAGVVKGIESYIPGTGAYDTKKSQEGMDEYKSQHPGRYK